MKINFALIAALATVFPQPIRQENTIFDKGSLEPDFCLYALTQFKAIFRTPFKTDLRYSFILNLAEVLAEVYV